MRLLIAFAREYPSRSLIMLGCLLLAAIAEGVGISSMLPLLSIVTTGAQGTSKPDSPLEQAMHHALASVGLHPTIGLLLVVIVIGIFVKAALVLLAQRQVGYTVAHVATDLRLALLRALLAARWPYYVSQPVGSLANSFATEAQRASEAYLYGTTIVSQGIQTVLYGAVALSISWRATLGAAVVGTAITWSLNGLVRMTKRAGAAQTDLLKTLLARMSDVLFSVKPVKAMGRESLVTPLLEAETEDLNSSLRRQVLSKEAVRALQEPFFVAALAAGLYLAVSVWSMALDSVMVLAVVFGRALNAMAKVQKQYQAMVASESAYWSLRHTIEEAGAAAETVLGREEPRLEKAIALRGITFGYNERVILRDVDMEIVRGGLTALIGPSGAGKTSSADLILGLVRPQKGEVYLDDVPLAEIDLAAWRRSVGYVPQETFLLHDTVRVNVSLGDPDVEDAAVEAALRAAGAWEFMASLDEGLDTNLGERGSRLSGGQRQRIAIARALVHRPQLLILDEATASLDPASEADIYETVRKLRGETTIFAISHQKALLEVADRVYRLEDGHVHCA